MGENDKKVPLGPRLQLDHVSPGPETQRADEIQIIHGPRSGQGRPLGHLMRWLQLISIRGGHVRRRIFSKAERVDARAALHDLAAAGQADAVSELFGLEDDEEDSEPEVIT